MDKRPRRGWREGTGEGDESVESEIREGPKLKTEDGKAPGFVKEEEEHQFYSHHYDEEVQGRPPPPPPQQQTPPSLQCKHDDPFNAPHETKQPPAMEHQRGRQFTFQMDHPPPPPQPQPSSLIWRTDNESQSADPTMPKIEELVSSSPPPFLQRDQSLPATHPRPLLPPLPLQHYGHAPTNH